MCLGTGALYRKDGANATDFDSNAEFGAGADDPARAIALTLEELYETRDNRLIEWGHSPLAPTPFLRADRVVCANVRLAMGRYETSDCV
jgi:hypothetical protein